MNAYTKVLGVELTEEQYGFLLRTSQRDYSNWNSLAEKDRRAIVQSIADNWETQ